MNTNEKNKQAWNTGAYEAWMERFGPPAVAAQKLMQNPEKKIGEIYKFFDNVKNKKIINLMGSNGMKAVALSLLGADVTVVDFSTENKQYSQELANAADVNLRYILSDILELPSEELSPNYDIVFMENGILHYFLELKPLFNVVSTLLKSGGRMVLQDFHPVSTKLISSRGTTAKIRKHKVNGDYFDTSLEERDISFSKYIDGGGNNSKVYLRNWNLGEVVTAIADSGLYIKELKEFPNLSSDVFDVGIPKSFIVVAEKL